MPSKELLNLSDSQINWVDGVEDNCWVINTPDNEKLFKIPRCVIEAKDAAAISRFAKKYELEAFNIGVQFGKNELKELFESKMERALLTIKELEEMNMRLSSQLERFIIGEDER